MAAFLPAVLADGYLAQLRAAHGRDAGSSPPAGPIRPPLAPLQLLWRTLRRRP
jgi:hypothetical protein